MDLETRQLAAFVGKTALHIRDILSRAQVQRFEILRGTPNLQSYPHWMALTDPVDYTSASLIEEELTKAFWFDPRHEHAEVRPSRDTEARTREQVVYLAWKGSEYPGSGHLRA